MDTIISGRRDKALRGGAPPSAALRPTRREFLVGAAGCGAEESGGEETA